MEQSQPAKPSPDCSATERLRPVSTGLVIGLAWGLLVAFLDGLPLLLQGSLLPHLGPRLLSLAYLAAIYGLLFGLAGILLASAGWLVYRLVGRPGTRAGLAGLVGGLLAAAAGLLFGLQRYEPEAAGWFLILVLSGALGLLAGWLTRSAARTRALSWRALRMTVLAAYLAAVLAVLVVAGYRTTLRDLPLFNRPATDQVATPQQPNIVLVTAAGLRPDHLGAYGYDPAISPNIDALAQEGMRFERAFVQVGNCMPSRNVMYSGLFPHSNRVEGFYQVRDPQYPVLCDLMQQGGYFTAIRGKVGHSTPFSPYHWDLVLDSVAPKPQPKDIESYYQTAVRGIEAAGEVSQAW